MTELAKYRAGRRRCELPRPPAGPPVRHHAVGYNRIAQTSYGGAPTGPQCGPARCCAVGNVAPARGHGTNLSRIQVSGQYRTVGFGELRPSGHADHHDPLGEHERRFRGVGGQGIDAPQKGEQDRQPDQYERPAAAQRPRRLQVAHPECGQRWDGALATCGHLTAWVLTGQPCAWARPWRPGS